MNTWTAFNSQNGRIFKSWRVQDEFGDIVATLNSNHVDEVSRAQLIAAAPELLEACKAAVAALSQPVQFSTPDDRVFDNRPVEILRGDAKFARETLQSAIAKATKGQN